ncbi:MAG TPA: NAD(P)-dependent oxidoreductase, partial [Armatimonadota bacterium]|nr:NAD(P)-dependent oxidoreductase [Armatimonadota bacterium]
LDPHFRRLEVLFPPEELARIGSFADLVWARNQPIPPEELAPLRGELDAVVTCGWRYGPVQEFSCLRAILEVSGGFPDPRLLDYEHCFRRGLRVLSCAPGFAPAVAEMALGMAIAAGRRIAVQDAAFRTGEERWGHLGDVHDFTLFDQPVGFIGFGGIARCLKSLLEPFRCPVSVYDPWQTDAHLRGQGVKPLPLETLLESSRVLFVLAVPSAENRALLDRSRLERLRPDALLVLVSRAHLVDFDALVELTRAGRFTAAIDVFPEEPLPPDHPIRRVPGVLLSPHCAGGGEASYRRIGRMVVNDLEAVLTGRVPQEMQPAQPEYILRRGAPS